MLKLMSFLSLLLCLAMPLVARAEVVAIPRLESPVIDEAGMLNRNEKTRLEERLYSLKDAFQMQVWITPTLGDESIEALSIRAVDSWKLGNAQDDRGLLLLIAVNDRKMRLEVGHGLEGEIPDALAARILDYLLRPALRAGDFAGGVSGVVDEITAVLKVGEHPPERQVPLKDSHPAWMALLLPLFFFLMLGRLFSGLLGVGRRRRYGPWIGGGWGGGGGFGGGSGGGWSGGGGSFGGGGSSSSW